MSAFDGGFKSVVGRASLVGIAFSFDSIRVSRDTRSQQRFETDWVNPSPSGPWAAKPTENFACQFTAFSQHSFTHAFGAGKSQGTCGKRLMGEPLWGVIRRTSQSSSSYPRDSRLRIPATAKGLLLTDAKYPMFAGMKAWRTPNCIEGCGRTGWGFSAHEHVMPMIILSHRCIHEAASDKGGWNKAQLALLGIEWPPVRGWLYSLVGKEISDQTWGQVMALRGVKPKEQRKLFALERQGELL